MGLLDGINQNAYYTTPAGYGNYQFTTLEHIINAFMITNVGESKLITKVNRTDVQFHGMRAIQELSYDVLRSVKSQEIEVPPSLTMILPQDYVNYVKLSVIGSDGIEKNLYPTGKTSNPFAIAQDGDGVYQYTDVSNDGQVDTLTEQDPSNTWESYQSQTSEPSINASDATDVEIDFAGRRYGLDPQHAHMHGSFYIDYLRGFIHFSSAVAGKTISLKYVSDGLGTDAEMIVHKFAEEAVYKHIAYAILASRSNIPEYIVARFKKERFAETRKAKIRLSNIKIEEFTQVLKGMGKQIK
tara:strand:- start:12969 stop:13862 length:894 start_codon:yes stop_codon:yes gene_type:complete